MTRVHLPALVIALAAAACAPAPTLTSTVPSPATPVPPTQAGAYIHVPEGWNAYRSDALGFGFAYPPSGTLVTGERAILATIGFAPDPSTNVVQESITLSGAEGAGTCASPLAAGWAPDELESETIELNGVLFLRQTHAGVAAGTSTVWVAYTTERGERCVSIGYELSTFDPANLDPTRFPTPPVNVDWQEKVQGFEAVVATFVWLW